MKTFLYIIVGLGIIGGVTGGLFCFEPSSDVKKNEENTSEFTIRELPRLVVFEKEGRQEGVSAAYSGVLGDAIVLAGGCNFPELPAAEGGPKVYYQEIYVLRHPKEDEKAWVKAGNLPVKVANGASVSVPEGIVCIGGKTTEGSLKNVWLLQWEADEKTVVTRELASLPYEMDDLTAATDGRCIYVAGGNVAGQAGQKCLVLEGIEAKGWQELPDYPGPARLQPVGIYSKEKFYLLGGFQPVMDGKECILSTNGLCLDLKTKQWSSIGDICPEGEQESRAVIGGAGQLWGEDQILIVGGVNKSVFKSAVDNLVRQEEAKKENLQTELLRLQREKEIYLKHEPEWYQFNKQILTYNMNTGKWRCFGDFSALARAGAALVAYQDKWVVAQGEIKPGIRAANVYMIEWNKMK